MKKQALITGISAVLALSATNAMADDFSKAYNGFYGTLHAGYSLGKSSQEYTVLTSGYDPDKTSISVDGGLVGLGLGWGRVMSTNVYWGGEIFGNLSDISGEFAATNSGNYFTMKKRSSYGIAAKLGKVVGNSLFYAKFGVVSGQWRINSNGGAGLAKATGRKNLGGLTAGFGVEHMMTQKLALGADVAHTWHKSFTYQHGTIYKNKMKPSATEIKAILSWKF